MEEGRNTVQSSDGFVYKRSLSLRPKAREDMSCEEVDSKLQRGYDQMLRGETVSLEAALERLERGLLS
jgi:hypothetical protein